jgi:hypothetical protein
MCGPDSAKKESLLGWAGIATRRVRTTSFGYYVTKRFDDVPKVQWAVTRADAAFADGCREVGSAAAGSKLRDTQAKLRDSQPRQLG